MNMNLQQLLLVLLFPAPCLSFTLVTFDVDGTLVHGSGRAAAESSHARAFAHAVATHFNNGQPITPVAEALPRRLYQGSTDGLILLRLAKATCGVEPYVSFAKLDELMQCMYDYMMELNDDDITEHIQPLPGVIENLEKLAKMKDSVYCGLVTGNVEGIARRKMKAVGVLETGALSRACSSQLHKWSETEHISFLGGFGSDYCSGDIDNLERNHLDRGEQIAIAAQRCSNQLPLDGNVLKRVVHVGDAPADVLAAKAFQEQISKQGKELTVGMVAVATGSYTAEELQELCGEPVPGQWEPVVLEEGMASPIFLQACGLDVYAEQNDRR